MLFASGTSNFGLTIGGRFTVTLSAYTDGDWTEEIETRRSTNGHLGKIGKGIVL